MSNSLSVEPIGEASAELEVRNSRFIGRGRPISFPEDVRLAIDTCRREFPDATHVVHAFLIGQAKSEIAGCGDDGEPRGTAGKPVLEIIRGRHISNVLVLVVRYYGGTKLGTGGLVHAYGDCARRTLDCLPVRPLLPTSDFCIVLPYDLHEAVIRLLRGHGAQNLQQMYETQVTIIGELPESQWELCDRELRNVSRGRYGLRRATDIEK